MRRWGGGGVDSNNEVEEEEQQKLSMQQLVAAAEEGDIVNQLNMAYDIHCSIHQQHCTTTTKRIRQRRYQILANKVYRVNKRKCQTKHNQLQTCPK